MEVVEKGARPPQPSCTTENYQTLVTPKNKINYGRSRGVGKDVFFLSFISLFMGHGLLAYWPFGRNEIYMKRS